MFHLKLTALYDNLNIIWTIAVKDIIDAIKNKVVISMIVMSSLTLLVPRLLPLIFEQPEMALPVYTSGDSQTLAKLTNNPGITVVKVDSELELRSALCGGIFPVIGLSVPADIDSIISTSNQVVIPGYACWSWRFKTTSLKSSLEAVLTRTLGKPVIVNLDEHIVFPPQEGVLLLNITNINAVLILLMMGIFLVPSLLLEEKETKTIQALLVSPASISQVVLGKTLAGVFYILVTALVILTVSFAEVVHWEMALLFVGCGAFFSVAIGLLLGSLFDKQQDMVGWMTGLLLFLVGAILVQSLNMQVPIFVKQILPWLPSIALADICRSIYSEQVPSAQILFDVLDILVISLPIYAVVAWRIRRSDR